MTAEALDREPSAARRPVPSRSARGRRASREQVELAVLGVLRWAGIAFFLVITVLPFYYMLLLSFRSIAAVVASPADLVVAPAELSLDAFREVLTPVARGGQGFLTFLRNSGLVAVGTVALTLVFAVPGAYAVSRLDFFGKRTVSVLFLSVYLFPGIVLAIPLFVLFTKLGLRDSLPGLVLVYMAQTVPVALYMLRNYFETVPVSLEEAAAVDGASRLGIIRRVSLPLALPALAATSLYVFMIAWNEFLFAFLFLTTRREAWTVSLGLSQLVSVEVPTTLLMAGSIILTVPIIVLFFFAERLLVEGLTGGAEKG
jgi:multiple sugar transport system permease protein